VPPLYVEGTATSSAINDVTLTLAFVASGQTLKSSSKTLTVFDTEISECDSAWLPKRPGDSGYKTAITATVHPSLGSVSKDFKFTLLDVSAMLGYCTNAGSETTKDLMFESQTGWTISGTNSEFAQKSGTMTSQASVDVSSFDYGAYGKIKCEVTMLGQTYTAHVSGGSQLSVTVPRDTNNNHIADAWAYDAGNADDDAESGSTLLGDGLTRYEEYRGVDINGDGFITPDERLNPNTRRDLFIKGDGFDASFPLVWGNAFQAAGVDVHEVSSSAGSRDIDILTIHVTNAGDDLAHITRYQAPSDNTRFWGYRSSGYTRNLGTATTYYNPDVYKDAINYAFNDKPFVDGATWSSPGQWTGAPNGMLDMLSKVEDADDDGGLDDCEKDGNVTEPYDDGDTSFDGDYPCVAPGIDPHDPENLITPDKAAYWTYNHDLNPLNIDDDQYIEWPTYSDPEELDPENKDAREYSVEDHIRETVTHEMGHAVGIRTGMPGGHCTDPTCCMYRGTDVGFNRYDHFCAGCTAYIKIHNNASNDP
jgi:hypothetical protein